MKKQRAVIPSVHSGNTGETFSPQPFEISEGIPSTPPEPAPETPVENLPVLAEANRILWGRMGAAVLSCLLVIIAAVLFDSCG